MFKARQILSGAILLLVLGSCLTEARIARNCNRFLEVCGTPTSTTIYKDTTIVIKDTITVPLPPDTVIVKGDVIIKDGLCSFKPVYVEGNLIATTVEVTNGKLYVKSYIRKKSIDAVINMTVNLPNAIRETNTKIVVPERYIPTVYKWAFWIVLAQLLIGILLLLKKFNIFNPFAIVTKLIGK